MREMRRGIDGILGILKKGFKLAMCVKWCEELVGACLIKMAGALILGVP